MTARTFPTLPGCGRAASARIEMYSATPGGGLHGSLDGAGYACAEHVDQLMAAVSAAGFTPYVARGSALTAGARCGGGYDYTTRRAVAGPAAPDGHPTWCARVTDDGPCEVAGWHASAWITVPADIDDAPLIEAQLFTAGPDVLVALRFTYDLEVTNQQLPLDQAATLAGVLSGLVAQGGGR